MTKQIPNLKFQIPNWAAVVCPAMWAFCVGSALAQPEPSPPEMLPDAELAAVTFADADRGWAVGDRGVIWHTSDGGRSWKLQASGVTCRLEAVQFLDSDTGFAVGGWTQPYTHQTRGVVLRTRDGGRTWQNTPGLTLPGLRSVRFFNSRTGWALGDSSPLHPSGVFRTEDGGRTWTTVPKGQTPGWVAGDFQNPQRGVVAGIDGSLGLVTAEEVALAKDGSFGPRYLQRLLLARDDKGWLVGDGGFVFTTSDRGRTWTVPSGSLPEGAAELDFRALAVNGEHVWIAGAPGTTILHSSDAGQSWRLFSTNQTAPLRGLWFIDEHRGWAVGALGTILHTRDGGQSWRKQHGGGSRAAILGVFSESARLPLELIASQGGSEAFITAVEIVGRHDQERNSVRPQDYAEIRRVHEATVAAGGASADRAWQFSLPEAGLVQSCESILARWNQATDGQAQAELERRLVRRIRQWRPDVVITEDISPRGEDPLAQITSRVTLDAVAKAADAAAFPQEQSKLGLAPWKVKKVFTILGNDKQGVVNITPAVWLPRLSRSIADQAALGRQLLSNQVTLSPRNIGLALLVDHLPQDSGKRDVLSGILAPPASESRRALANAPPGNTEALSRVAQKRHNVAQLLERLDLGEDVGAGWLGQTGELTKDLPGNYAGEVLWQLSQKYQRAGRSFQAAECCRALIDKHPQHPLADAALTWLIQYYASGEAAWRQRKGAPADVRLAQATGNDEAAFQPVVVSDLSSVGVSALQPVVVASPGVPASSPDSLTDGERAGRALALASQLEATRPVLAADPNIRLPLAAAARRAGQARTAERITQRMLTSELMGEWSACARVEDWLLHPSDKSPPKKICSVVTAAHKPKLDGRLDDPLWQVAKPISLRLQGANDANLPTAAVLAFDEDFLYLALSCRKAAGVDYAQTAAPRVTDGDLSTQDFVSIMLDVDRDFATYWRLCVDHRGWPAEDCLGDRTWNPEWYIATGGDAEYWTIEAAIPLAELGPKKPEVRDVWAIGIQRVIPRVGLQSFTTPAALVPRAEGFGLLVFE